MSDAAADAAGSAAADAAPADAGAPDAIADYYQWDLVYPTRVQVPLYQQDWSQGDEHHTVINTGTLGLDMGTMVAGTSTDSHATSTFSMIVLNAPTATLAPGYAMGRIPAGDPSLVSEPMQQTMPILRFSGGVLPANGLEATIEVTHRITINGVLVLAPQTWEVADISSPQIVDWGRVSSPMMAPL